MRVADLYGHANKDKYGDTIAVFYTNIHKYCYLHLYIYVHVNFYKNKYAFIHADVKRNVDKHGAFYTVIYSNKD